MTTVLVTGANRGIGLEFAHQYAADGCDVIATSRDPARSPELAALAKSLPGLEIETLDVADASSVAGLTARCDGRPIDILINNAGIIGPVPVTEHIHRQHFGSLDYELWDRVIRTNTFGPVRMAEAFLPNLLAGRQKKLVSLSSTIGSIAERDTPAMAYTTSKTALNKAMKLLASELRDRGIIVALFCPGYVRTRLDFGTADVEVADSVTGLRKLISSLTLGDSGTFRRYNGEKIEW